MGSPDIWDLSKDLNDFKIQIEGRLSKIEERISLFAIGNGALIIIVQVAAVIYKK